MSHPAVIAIIQNSCTLNLIEGNTVMLGSIMAVTMMEQASQETRQEARESLVKMRGDLAGARSGYEKMGAQIPEVPAIGVQAGELVAEMKTLEARITAILDSMPLPSAAQ